MGLPPHNDDPTNEVYLYYGQSLSKYNEMVSLKPQLKAIGQSVLWLNVYIIPAENCANTNDLLANLKTKCAEELGKQIRMRYNELFPHHRN